MLNSPGTSNRLSEHESYDNLVKEFKGAFDDLELLRVHSEVSVLRAQARKYQRELTLIAGDILDLQEMVIEMREISSSPLQAVHSDSGNSVQVRSNMGEELLMTPHTGSQIS